MKRKQTVGQAMRSSILIAIACCALMLPTLTANARPVVASDNASDVVYNDGWQTGDNGGFGFGAWALSTSGGNAGFFTGTSNNNGDGGGTGIDTAGESFGLFANSNDNPSALASRPINNAIVVGETLTFGFDNGFVDGGLAPQFRLADSDGVARLTFQFVGGGNNYSVVDAGGTQNFGNGNGANDLGGYTDGGLVGIFTLTGLDTYALRMMRLDQPSQTATISGTLAGIGGSGITRLQAFTNARGGGGSGDYFVNSFQIETLAVVPEPGTLSLLVFAAGMVGVAGIRRKGNQ
ncbi:MAG: PEP-CTERM sorting domain-containing protein [Fibrella sp.]|nr:PEP-CTERM sorting domain-containing protein [Armatimonadota bacterium]